MITGDIETHIQDIYGIPVWGPSMWWYSSGRHPLPCPQRGAGCEESGIHCHFIAYTDDLTGADAAVHATFPQAEIQNCIIHQPRNSSKYVLQLYTLC